MKEKEKNLPGHDMLHMPYTRLGYIRIFNDGTKRKRKELRLHCSAKKSNRNLENEKKARRLWEERAKVGETENYWCFMSLGWSAMRSVGSTALPIRVWQTHWKYRRFSYTQPCSVAQKWNWFTKWWLRWELRVNSCFMSYLPIACCDWWV